MRHGKYSEEYQYLFENLLSASSSNIDSGDILSDYLTIQHELNQKLTPLEFTARELHSQFQGMLPLAGHNYSVIITDEKLDDFCVQHCLGWYKRFSILLVPHKYLQDDKQYETLAIFLKNNVRGNYFSLLSESLDWAILKSIKVKLKTYLIESHLEVVDIYKCNYHISIPTVYQNREQQIIALENKALSFRVPYFKISEVIENYDGWVSEIDISPELGETNTILPSSFMSLAQVIDARVTNNGVYAKQINKKRQYYSIKCPTAEQLFSALLQEKDYISTQDTKGRYYLGILELLGGIDSFEILKTPYTLSLIDSIKASQRGIRKGLTFDDLCNKVRIGRNWDEPKHIMSVLAHRNILLRGYNIQCPHCDLDIWYDIKDINGELLVCVGCKHTFQIPIKLQFSYVLNELFVQGLKQGAKSVLFTVYLFYKAVTNNFIWQPSCKVAKESIDIDILAMCDGGLIVAECKDGFYYEELAELYEIVEQIERNYSMACKLNANAFILSTIISQKEIPQQIIDCIENLETTSTAVILLTQQELLEDKRLEDDLKDIILQKRLPEYTQTECFEDGGYPKISASGVHWTVFGNDSANE